MPEVHEGDREAVLREVKILKTNRSGLLRRAFVVGKVIGMTTNARLVDIDETIKADADVTIKCGEYSQANPTVALKDNPFFAATIKASRAVSRKYGRQAIWHCPNCGRVTTAVDVDDLLGGYMTRCCGSKQVEMRTKS